MEERVTGYVSTAHLDVAAFLLVRGYQIERTDWDGGTIIFVFRDPAGNGKAAISEFYKDALVGASEYASAQKRCRDLMWERRRGNGNGKYGNTR